MQIILNRSINVELKHVQTTHPAAQGVTMREFNESTKRNASQRALQSCQRYSVCVGSPDLPRGLSWFGVSELRECIDLEFGVLDFVMGEV